MKKHQLFYNAVVSKGKEPLGFKPAGKLSIEEAFGVYQQGYIARLTEALGDTYESVWRVLGDDIFFQTCREFISKYPSQSYNLSDYSVKFVDFMISHPVSEDFPFLPDLAHLGWLHKEVFHRSEELGLMGEELLSSLSTNEDAIRLADNFEILKSNYRLFNIWKALQAEVPLPDGWNQSQNIAIYKMDHQVYLREITIAETLFFENLKAGMNVLTACDKLSTKEIATLFEFLSSARCLIKS